MRHDDGHLLEQCLVVESARCWQKAACHSTARCSQPTHEHGVTISATPALEAVLLDPAAQLPKRLARGLPREHVGQEGGGVRGRVGADLVVKHIDDGLPDGDVNLHLVWHIRPEVYHQMQDSAADGRDARGVDVLERLSWQRLGKVFGCLRVDLSQGQYAFFAHEVEVVILDGVEEANYGLAEMRRWEVWDSHLVSRV